MIRKLYLFLFSVLVSCGTAEKPIEAYFVKLNPAGDIVEYWPMNKRTTFALDDHLTPTGEIVTQFELYRFKNPINGGIASVSIPAEELTSVLGRLNNFPDLTLSQFKSGKVVPFSFGGGGVFFENKEPHAGQSLTVYVGMDIGDEFLHTFASKQRHLNSIPFIENYAICNSLAPDRQCVGFVYEKLNARDFEWVKGI